MTPLGLRERDGHTAADIAAMREWIADCEWADLAPDAWGDAADIDALTDGQVLAGIARHYAGGLPQFLADGR